VKTFDPAARIERWQLARRRPSLQRENSRLIDACSTRFDSSQIASTRKSGSLLAEGNESRIDRADRARTEQLVNHLGATKACQLPAPRRIATNRRQRGSRWPPIGDGGRLNVEVEILQFETRPTRRERRPPVVFPSRSPRPRRDPTPAYNNSLHWR